MKKNTLRWLSCCLYTSCMISATDQKHVNLREIKGASSGQSKSYRESAVEHMTTMKAWYYRTAGIESDRQFWNVMSCLPVIMAVMSTADM